MPMPLSGLAQTLSNSVAHVQADIVDTQNQLAAGVKTLNPGQAGVVTRLSAQATGYDQTLTNIASAQSVISVAQSSLSSIATVLTQMQALANQASSAGLQAADRDSLNSTFTNLATQVASLGTNASVNANNLLSGTNLVVTTGIAGNTASNTTVNGVNIAAIAATVGLLQINASAAAPTESTTANVHKVDTVAFGGSLDAAAKTYTVGGLTFTTNATFTALTPVSSQDAALATAFANFISGSSLTSTYGAFSGATQSSMAAVYSSATTGGTNGVNLLLTFANPGTQSATVATTTGAATPSVTPGSTAAANQIDRVTFNSQLLAGQSVSVGGIVYTATATSTVAQQAADFAAFITSGATSNYGTFSGVTYASAHNTYSTAAQVGSTGAIDLTWASAGVQTPTVTQDNGTSNAANAVASLTTQLQTISTGQATLSAAATGLSAQNTANIALKTGLTNTVNSIQNIDATAMQAKLQQLNNQQSIDYYLVSQMNTEAAAILSIFR
ncbi:hypothetical protein G6702_03275 [Polynucleobacter paneuropaeus]|nr:hypothetical protein G6702_03275 [Polynucleobacter paneuropaeus]